MKVITKSTRFKEHTCWTQQVLKRFSDFRTIQKTAFRRKILLIKVDRNRPLLSINLVPEVLCFQSELITFFLSSSQKSHDWTGEPRDTFPVKPRPLASKHCHSRSQLIVIGPNAHHSFSFFFLLLLRLYLLRNDLKNLIHFKCRLRCIHSFSFFHPVILFFFSIFSSFRRKKKSFTSNLSPFPFSSSPTFVGSDRISRLSAWSGNEFRRQFFPLILGWFLTPFLSFFQIHSSYCNVITHIRDTYLSASGIIVSAWLFELNIFKNIIVEQFEVVRRWKNKKMSSGNGILLCFWKWKVDYDLL